MLLIAALASLISLGTHLRSTYSYQARLSSHSHRRSLTLHSLLKKGKLKEIDAFIENISEEHNLQTYLESGQKAYGIGSPYNFFNSTLNRFNSITIMV